MKDFKITEPFPAKIPEGPSWFLAIEENNQEHAEAIMAAVTRTFDGVWPRTAPILIELPIPSSEYETAVQAVIVSALKKKKWTAEFGHGFDGRLLKLTPILDETP